MAAAARHKAEDRSEKVGGMPNGATATIGDALGAVAGSIGSAIVTSAAQERLLEVGDKIPLSSGAGIECPLNDPDRADLAVRFLSTEPATDALSDTPLLIDGDAAAAVAGMARRWCGDASRASGARIMWLELDLPAGSTPIPSVFVGPGNPPRGAPVDRPTDDEWAAVVDLLCPRQPAWMVEKLCAALPSGAWIGYVGVMRGRELRATVSGLSAADIPPLLDRINWPGETSALAPILAMAHTHGPRITLGLDLTEGIGPALGIEVSPLDPDGWGALLEAVAVLTPISKAAHNALLAWQGLSVANDQWPDRLRTQAGCIVRRLNHLKCSLNPVCLKAYLYFGLV
jgi:hypothetical protein